MTYTSETGFHVDAYDAEEMRGLVFSMWYMDGFNKKRQGYFILIEFMECVKIVVS